VDRQLGREPEQSGAGAPDAGADETGRRLDALSRPLAERVIARAIELQHEVDHGPDRISRATLERIADELGLDRAVLSRALLEELDIALDGPLGRRQRWLAPDRLTGGRVVAGSPEQVAAGVQAWMTRQEGLRPRSRRRAGIRWEKSSDWRTNVRRTLKVARGTGALRNLPSVEHRQTSVGSAEQLVEIDADTSVISRAALGVGAGLGALGVGVGVAVAAGIDGGPDLVQFLAGWLPLVAAGAASAVALARRWLGWVRRGMERALDGIANPEFATRRRDPGAKGWKKVLEDAVDEFLD
jgi:hypothetical protein